MEIILILTIDFLVLSVSFHFKEVVREINETVDINSKNCNKQNKNNEIIHIKGHSQKILQCDCDEEVKNVLRAKWDWKSGNWKVLT